MLAAAGDSPIPDESAVLVTTPMRRPSALVAYNVLRFASVLLGAGLLLRSGASEQAISAISYEVPHREQAAKARIALRNAALTLAGEAQAGSSEAGHAPSAATKIAEHRQRIAVPRLAALTQSTPGRGDLRPASPAPSIAATSAKALLQDAVMRAPAPGKVAATSPLASSAPITPNTFSLARRSRETALLAPVKVASRPLAVAATRTPAASISSTPSTLAPSVRTASGTLQASSADAAPAAGPPVKLSLALPVMTPGPRTTALTSNIKDVMRRPASAWDYAEALPGELTGYGAPGQRSADGGIIPATQPALASAPTMAPTPAPTRLAASVTRLVAVGPVPANKLPEKHLAANLLAANHTSGARGAAARSGLATRIEQAPVQQSVSRPLALVDSPPATALKGAAAKANQRSAAILPANRRSAVAPVLSPVQAPVQAPAPAAVRPLDRFADKRLSDAGLKARLGFSRSGWRREELVVDPSAPATRMIAAPRTVPATGSAGTSVPDHGGLADASAAPTLIADAASPQDGGLSLRDRIPRPAF